MENKKFASYYFCSFISVLIAAGYPIYMGIKVCVDMIRFGNVKAEDYPKYIIPYTPIALAVIIGVALLPVMIKCFKKYSLLVASAISSAIFLGTEVLLENMIVVKKTYAGIVSTGLKDWQMSLCVVIPPKEYTTETWTEIEKLTADYSPAFKLHFYIISFVIILSLLNCFYGYAKIILSGKMEKLRAVIVQSVASVLFLGMCIWACFTAFYRTANIYISPISAVLMSVFFVLFGVTAGLYVSSFTLGRRKLFSVVFPSITAFAITVVMYIGEMILLDGRLYRFGTGVLFDGLPGIVLSLVDIAVVIAAGAVTAILSLLLNRNKVVRKNGELYN